MKVKTQHLRNVACVAVATGLLAACDADFANPVDEATLSAGTADFTRFVALGDSLTAGFADSALYTHGQENSFPAILAQQFAAVGGGDFTQPLTSDNNGGLLLAGSPIAGTRLVLTGSPLAPASVSEAPTTEVSDIQSGPFNNMGVPGAKSFHLGATGYGNIANLPAAANPYFVRMAGAPDNTMIADTLTQVPTFFVLWIGNNDTLAYATTGGTGADQLGNFDPTTYGTDDLTDPTVFAGTYSGLVTALTANDAKGVLVNLPDVTSIPYFTTVPYNAIPLDEASATASNAAYAAYNAGLTMVGLSAEEVAQRTITFAAGQNALVIEDETLTDASGAGLPSIRQATAEDYILLPSSSKIGTEAVEGDPTTVWGIGTPMADGDVLSASEAALVAAANAAFNATIEGIADGNDNLALFDAAGALATLSTTGINYGTGTITSTFATGGGFSLDGVHPTARGYAVIANFIMDTIESDFGATLAPVDPGAYTTTFIE